jgi:hypothetical protein
VELSTFDRNPKESYEGTASMSLVGVGDASTKNRREVQARTGKREIRNSNKNQLDCVSSYWVVSWRLTRVARRFVRTPHNVSPIILVDALHQVGLGVSAAGSLRSRAT